MSFVLTFGNTSFGMEKENNCDTSVLEKVFLEARAKNIPLQKVLTQEQLLQLTDLCFEKAMPVPASNCKELFQVDELERIEEYSLIDLLQQDRLALLLALPKDVAQEKIQDQFERMKVSLNSEERKSWENLVKYFRIDLKSIFSFDDIKTYSQSLLNKEYGEIWSKQLPAQWVVCLKQALKDNQISEGSVKAIIGDSDNKHLPENFGLFTSVEGPFKEKAAFVKFHKKFLKEKYPIEDFKHAAYHEVTHLLQGHCVIREKILIEFANRPYWRSFACTPQEAIIKVQKSAPYISFTVACERSADSLSSLKNSEAADSGRKQSLLYSGSYNYVATADTNWRALKLIQEK
jgi:hypothetical protein